MDTARIGSDEKRSRFQVPSVGVLIVLACFLLTGAVLLAWWTARSGIRRVEAIGSSVSVDWNPVSSFIMDKIDIDTGLLSTDYDVEAAFLLGLQVDDQFATVLRRFSNVEKVWISETSITDRTLADLAEIAHITHLYLFDSPGVTDAGIAELARLPNLRHLTIANLPITGAGLSRMTHLEGLYIYDCKTLELSAVQELGRLPNLRSLSLRELSVTDESLRGLAGALVLEELSLDSMDITDASLLFIVEQFPDLMHLFLSDLDGITDEGVRQLVALKKLETLWLLDSSISAETAKAVQQALPGCEVYHESTGW